MSNKVEAANNRASNSNIAYDMPHRLTKKCATQINPKVATDRAGFQVSDAGALCC